MCMEIFCDVFLLDVIAHLFDILTELICFRNWKLNSLCKRACEPNLLEVHIWFIFQRTFHMDTQSLGKFVKLHQVKMLSRIRRLFTYTLLATQHAR